MKHLTNVEDINSFWKLLRHVYTRSKEKPIAYATRVGTFLLIVFCIYYLLIFFWKAFCDFLLKEKELKDIIQLVLCSWPGIYISIFLYILLDDRIKQPNEIPAAISRAPNELLKLFSDKEHTSRCLWILDTSIDTLCNEPNFETALTEAIKNVWPIKDSPSNSEGGVRILLLHPDTYAAEQRSKDLSNSTRTFLHQMKDGLGKLHCFLEDFLERNPKYRNKIQIRLFKKTPFMIYARWDSQGNFGILYPDRPADDITFNVHADLELGRSFNSNFIELWNDRDTIDYKEYLLVEIFSEGPEHYQYYWGGAAEDKEFPRYLFTEKSVPNKYLAKIVEYNETIKKSHYNNEPNDKYSEYKHFNIKHDGKIFRATLRPYMLNREANKTDEFEFASQQITKTIGIKNSIKLELEKCDIYELAYFHEKHRIRLDRMENIKKKLQRNGYVFVSHKHYDFQLDQKSLTYLSNLKNGFNHLRTDENDEKAIHEIQRKINEANTSLLLEIEYDPLPRQRLFAKYNCKLSGKGALELELTSENKSKGTFEICYTDKKTGRPFSSSKIEGRMLPSLEKEILASKQQILEWEQKEQMHGNEINVYKELTFSRIKLMQLKALEKTIQSTIEADLLLYIGEERFISTYDRYEAHVHLIRTQVNSAHRTGYPTMQRSQPASFDFQAIHLVDRNGILGGINHIKYSKPVLDQDGAYLLLQNTADSLFFTGKTNIPIGDGIFEKVNIDQYTTAIVLREGKSEGHCDILVINFVLNNERV